jgi:UDP-GlcNAc3NAcA epimerase
LTTILHIVGNRPQFVKLSVLHKTIKEAGKFSQQIVHSGQHFSYEMDGLFFKELNIPEPDINFNIQNSSPNQFIGEAAEKLQQYFQKQSKAVVFVYGDTNTTLAAAIAAKRTGLPLVHFEAGVRTGDNEMPEEINRLLTDRLADVNFCCTQKNVDTLLAEGYGQAIQSMVSHSGDLMLDAFLKVEAKNDGIILPEKFVLCTIHRAANLSDEKKLLNIISAFNELNVDIPVLMPVHPHTKKKMEAFGIKTQFTVLPPVGYPQMKNLMQHCKFFITDSGGSCREAYFSKKPSLIIMDKPFWPELMEAGAALRSDATKENILQQATAIGALYPDYDQQLFGNGHAAENIHKALLKIFGS